MHVISVCLHYGNVIWLPWQRPLTNWKKVQVHHRNVKRYHTVKRLQKSVHYIRRYSTKYAEPRREHDVISIRMFSAKTTGPILTKILHDIMALVALLYMHTQGVRAFRFRTPEQRVKVVDFDVWKKCSKIIGYHSNVPWATAKLMTVVQSPYMWLLTLKGWRRSV